MHISSQQYVIQNVLLKDMSYDDFTFAKRSIILALKPVEVQMLLTVSDLAGNRGVNEMNH